MDCTPGDANKNQEFEGNTIAKACRFDRGDLGPCSSGNYGYDTGKPCVLVKVNRVRELYRPI